MSQAKSGDNVKIHFVGKLDDGTVFDQSADAEPLEFKIGEGRIIPDLENGVVGLAAGEKKVINIPSENAYGPYMDELKIKVPSTEFPEDLKFEVGQYLQIDNQAGGVHMVKVLEIAETEVVLDGNHPLAGQNLTFEIELTEIA